MSCEKALCLGDDPQQYDRQRLRYRKYWAAPLGLSVTGWAAVERGLIDQDPVTLIADVLSMSMPLAIGYMAAYGLCPMGKNIFSLGSIVALGLLTYFFTDNDLTDWQNTGYRMTYSYGLSSVLYSFGGAVPFWTHSVNPFNFEGQLWARPQDQLKRD